MRLFGTALFSCLCIAVSCNPVLGAATLVEQLDSDAIVELAANFSDVFVREGPVGLWEQTQACYTKASSSPDASGLRNCIVMDEAGKALDDNYVRARAGYARNRPWYEDGMFRARMMKYSEETFGDPNAYADFWNMNKVGFGTALRKLNLNAAPVGDYGFSR